MVYARRDAWSIQTRNIQALYARYTPCFSGAHGLQISNGLGWTLMDPHADTVTDPKTETFVFL